MNSTNRTTDRRLEHRLVVRNDADESAESVLGDVDEYTMGLPTRHDHGITVQLYHLADGKPKTLDGRLFDLSPSGAKLAVTTNIPLGDAVGLCIQFDNSDVEISTAGSVCWIGHIPDGKLVIGCALAEPIPNAVFQKITDSGYLERRNIKRQKIAVCTRVRRNEDSAKPIDVRLDDYSEGGFCMFATEGFDPGEFVLLEIEWDGESCVCIPAEVRWQKSCEIGFSVGCRFVTNNGSNVFQNAVQRKLSLNGSADRVLATGFETQKSTTSVVSRIQAAICRLLGRRKHDEKLSESNVD